MSTTLVVFIAMIANWPSFRGPDASGVADAAKPPVKWDMANNRNVAWSTPIPGLGHSSPVVWGDRVFLTTAVPLSGRATDQNVQLKDGGSIGTDTRHSWRIYCLNRKSGRILWERTAYEGVPRVKRHSKASQASATPVTDGKHVVAIMGSEGMYAWDMNGKLLWKKDLGKLDQGYVDEPADEWSPGSSPILVNGLLIVQNDRHKDSWVAAYDPATGAEKWRSTRDEMPSWSTPAVHRGGAKTMLVTVSPKHIRGHDPATGKEVWSIPDGTQVKVVTPIIAGDLVIVTGGWPTAGRPIWGVRASTGEVVWKQDRGSPYTPTPIVYRDILYVCVDNGVLSAYDVKTGKRLYQQRIANDSGGFSASAVAADGHLYFPSEDGVVYVVKAGPTFELVARNDMGAMCLATPAISNDLMLVRTTSHLHALTNRRLPGDSAGLLDVKR
jgi:outer membrane protein assembly factor BamB